MEPLQPLSETSVDARALGGRIRALRRARGLTLVRLAGEADLSHPFLSQLERGLARPSMGSLDRIARALQSSVVELLAASVPHRRGVESGVLRSDHGLVGPYGLGTARLLASDALAFVPMECVGEHTEAGTFHAHDEDEFLVVVEGRLALGLGEQEDELGPGDSATIAPGTPHRWWSADGGRYRLVVVKEAPRAGAHRSGATLTVLPQAEEHAP